MRHLLILFSLFLWVEVSQAADVTSKFDCFEIENTEIMGRFKSYQDSQFWACRETVRGGLFQPEALQVCRKGLNKLDLDFEFTNSCLNTIKNVPFQNEALSLCQKINRGNNTEILWCLRTVAGKKYSNSSIHTCEDEAYRTGVSIYQCFDKSPATIIPIAVSPSDIPLPQGTQIILKNDLVFPALNTCTQLKNKDSGLACDICVDKASDEDRFLKARTMIIQQSQQDSNRRQTEFEIVNDPSVKTVRCISNEPMNLADKPGLREKLEKLGLGLSLPTPRDF